MRTVGGTKASTAALAASLALLAAGGAGAQGDEERSLEAVRGQIAELERRLADENAERDRAAAALKQAELDISAARSALAQLDARQREHRARAESLAEESAAAGARLDGERDALAAQLRVAYMNGREEALKLLLSQETPADFGRMVVYYDYFNRARTERIGAVAEHLASLARLTAQAERVRAELAALARARADEVAALERAQGERQTLIAELDSSIQAGGDEMARLRDEELRLMKLVTELGELLAAFPVNSEDPFPGMKGRLTWPVAGEIAGDFGKPRGAGIRWNGVLLASPPETPVRAVYHGRVAFADWLPGLGLLMVLDHGDGYMTLYGHNSALLKEPGDWVRPGEAIAEVGDTGGRSEASLYFEIRHDGEPVNPHDWVAE